MNKINIGILGCSSISKRKVLPAILKTDCFELKYIASRNLDKAKQFTDEFGGLPITYEELLRKEDVSAIYVSVPTGLHYYYGKEVLLSGKHLLLEKPFTDKLVKTQELLNISNEKKLVSMEGLSYLYHPVFNKLTDIIKVRNIVGEIKSIESSFGFPFPAANDIRNFRELGGGAILDCSIYPLSIAVNLLGGAFEKLKVKKIFNDNLGIDERGHVFIEWRNCCANLTYGFGFFYKNNVTVWGEEGILKIDRIFSMPHDFSGSIEIISKDGIQKISNIKGDQFELMLNAFYDRIVGNNNLIDFNSYSDILFRSQLIEKLIEM